MLFSYLRTNRDNVYIMDTHIITELAQNIKILEELLGSCRDDTRKYSTIRHVTGLFSDHNLYYLNYQLEYITEELYGAITGNTPTQERPCEI